MNPEPFAPAELQLSEKSAPVSGSDDFRPSPSAELPASGRPDGRDDRGRFAPGWPLLPDARGSLKTGSRSVYAKAGALPEQADIVALMAEKHAAYVADLGGRSALSQIKLDLVGRYQETDLLASTLAENIKRGGVVTGKGRTRAAVTAYLAVVDRQTRLAQLLGLERVLKPTKDAMAYMKSLDAEPAA
jgi:hypothetical protein